MKIEFQNSIARLSFLCRITDIKNCLGKSLIPGYKSLSNVVPYNNLLTHNGPTGLEPSNVLNLWSNILQSIMKLQKYWVIFENFRLHFIAR